MSWAKIEDFAYEDQDGQAFSSIVAESEEDMAALEQRYESMRRTELSTHISAMKAWFPDANAPRSSSDAIDGGGKPTELDNPSGNNVATLSDAQKAIEKAQIVTSAITSSATAGDAPQVSIEHGKESLDRTIDSISSMRPFVGGGLSQAGIMGELACLEVAEYADYTYPAVQEYISKKLAEINGNV